jgi:hypothetical protein
MDTFNEPYCSDAILPVMEISDEIVAIEGVAVEGVCSEMEGGVSEKELFKMRIECIMEATVWDEDFQILR